MSRRRLLPLLSLTAFLFVSSVGSAARPVGADLSTNQGVASYLSSKGMSAKGFVVQRGSLNYAGPRCPGRQWNCTKKTKVVQIASGRHGKNRLDCGPGGTLTKTTTAGTKTVRCVIVQVSTSGKNRAHCDLGSRKSSPVVLECQITQTNVSGDNSARVHQRVKQRDGADQRATLNATVTQTNGSGDNSSRIKQTIDQTTDDVSMATAPTQNQEGRFTARVCSVEPDRQQPLGSRSGPRPARQGVGQHEHRPASVRRPPRRRRPDTRRRRLQLERGVRPLEVEGEEQELLAESRHANRATAAQGPGPTDPDRPAVLLLDPARRGPGQDRDPNQAELDAIGVERHCAAVPDRHRRVHDRR